MRKILSFLLLLIMSVGMQAQKDVTKFLGIPVDGSKQGMMYKLRAKGYKYDEIYKMWKGEFNGRNVFIDILTHKNKVWRIFLMDVSESDDIYIKHRFNKLCNQFMNNEKYIYDSTDNQIIPDDEDISHEMRVNKKKYQASFFQKSEISYADLRKRHVWFSISENEGKYRIVMYYDNIYNEANGEDL